MKSRLGRAVVISSLMILSLFLGTPQARATEVLDQFFIPSPSAAYTIPISNQFASFIDGAQTFTVGIAGQLTHVDVWLGFNSTRNGLIIDIRPLIAGVPTDPDSLALASAFVPSSSIPSGRPTFVSVDLVAAGLMVSPDEQLAIGVRGAVRGVDDSMLDWQGDVENPYPLGSAFVRTNSEPWTHWTQSCAYGLCDIPANQVDLGFKTFVTPSVPEPSSLTLMLAGIMSLGASLVLKKYRSEV